MLLLFWRTAAEEPEPEETTGRGDVFVPLTFDQEFKDKGRARFSIKASGAVVEIRTETALPLRFGAKSVIRLQGKTLLRMAGYHKRTKILAQGETSLRFVAAGNEVRTKLHYLTREERAEDEREVLLLTLGF